MARPRPRLPGLAIVLMVGCLSVGCIAPPQRSELRESLGKGCQTRSRNEPIVEHLYRLGVSDQIEVRFPGHSEWGGTATLQVDGTVRLGQLGDFLADGLTTTDLEGGIAQRAGLPRREVHVEVISYTSQRVYVFGLIHGRPRAVDYRGPETVVDLLQRIGGIKSGAALNEIHIVRPRVAEGLAPGVFQIDVEEILLDDDEQSNVRVRPGDQIYIGETRRSWFTRVIPPWLRPIFQTICVFCPSPNSIKRRPLELPREILDSQRRDQGSRGSPTS